MLNEWTIVDRPAAPLAPSAPSAPPVPQPHPVPPMTITELPAAAVEPPPPPRSWSLWLATAPLFAFVRYIVLWTYHRLRELYYHSGLRRHFR